MGRDSRLIVTGFGAGATTALGRLVLGAQGGDPLAPVDVVVPSGAVGVTVRRRIAGRGLANVRFGALPQLAERLAVRHLALSGLGPLTDSARSVAVMTALHAGAGPVAGAARNRGTAALVEALFAEMDGVAPTSEALDGLAGTGSRGAEIADLYRGYRQVVGGLADYPRVLRAAVDAVEAGEAPDTQVVLFAPRRLSTAERGLLECLAHRDRLRCVFGRVADAGSAEDATREALDWLETLIGPGEQADDAPHDRPGGAHRTLLELAPDPDEEVRLAVRRVVEFLGTNPVRPERVAIAFRQAVPYVRLLGERLTDAGLPHRIPSGRTLAQSVTGSTLMGLLDLPAHDFGRADLMAWLSGAPIRDGSGAPVPFTRWERESRDAGVSRGARRWRERLTRHAYAIRERRATVEDDDPEAEQRRASLDRRIEACAGLADFVDEIADTCRAVAEATSWAATAGVLRTAVVRFLGSERQVDRWGGDTDAGRWPGVERDAYRAVLAAVDALAGLDSVAGLNPSYDLVREALAAELDTTLPSGTTMGRGIAVAGVRELAGADLDLLIVLGMTEGAFPPRLREHPLAGDTLRAAVDGLLTVADRRGDERHDFLAAVAGSATVVLSCPRADPRAQRALHPSPWFLDAASLIQGERVEGGRLAGMTAPWLSRHDSFEAALRAAVTPASPHEADVLLAATGHQDVLVAVDDRYGRGRRAVSDRRDGVFGEWTGRVPALVEPTLSRVNGRLSATALQVYATCPLRFWLEKVLRVPGLEDPGAEDTVDPLAKGTLVHDVLERFFAAALPRDDAPGRDPDQAWSRAEIEQARELLDAAAEELAATGRTGRPLLWQAQRARLHRQLTRILAVDSETRRDRRARPIALEDAFGRDGRPPLILRLPRSGEVPLAGYIDRVDRTDDGTLVVTDYKTGKGSGYDRIPELGSDPLSADTDLVDRGRKLQLVLYALAARQAHGTPDTPVESYYWFVEQGSLRRGARIGSDAESRFLDVLDVTVSGIRAGTYPARPGEETYFGWESCGFCPYDRICPAARGQQWERVRTHPAVHEYAGLAEASGVTPAGQGGGT